ncbi:MAG TPA: alpha-amylase family glycosyl hydrolase [Kiritimatiellia bacterium]|nr:alpha-amylase family glycosyl hydrolase [Kiritimatiellia bacterium]
MKSWIPKAVIYQINLRSLAYREPRNAFEAATEKPLKDSPLAYVAKNLPTIKKLGANVLYFMPPYPIGFEERKGIGSPYSIRDFQAIEPEYGTLDDMADLVRKAHRLGFKVIFDITPNHTSRDHVWINQHPEFYVKRDNGDIFYDCDWSDTAKLDYTQPALRNAMTAIYDYWLSFLGTRPDGQPDGIDGFRLDMAHFINDKSYWNEAMPVLKQRHAGRELLFLAECYGLHNNLDLFDRGINAAYDDDFYKNCQYLYGIDTAFHSRILPEDGIENNHDYRDRYQAFLDGGIAGAFAKALTNYEERNPRGSKGPFVARYTDNHDEGRGMYLFGEGTVRAVNELIFFAPHTLPFLLTGEEFGALNRPPIHDRLNPIGKRRRILEANGTVRTQEAVEFEGNVFLRGDSPRKDLYTFFQTLITLRKKNPAFTQGSFTLLDPGEQTEPEHRSVIAFARSYRNQTFHVAVNLGPEPRTLLNLPLFKGTPIYGRLDGNQLHAFSSCVVDVAT